MKTALIKRLALFLVVAMLVAVVPVYAAADEADVKATDTVIHFVSYEDTNKLSGMSSYLSNPKTFTKDGASYLRIDVQQVYDVKFTLDGKEGVKSGEYVGTVVGRDGKSSEVTYFTYDYAVKDITAVQEGAVTYFVPGYFTESQSHKVYVVIGNDIEEAKSKLAVAIDNAEAATPKNDALQAALKSAKAVNNFVSKKADIEAAHLALVSATLLNPSDAKVYFVNHSDVSKLSSMVGYFANPKIYTKDEVTYLRIDVQQVYDVKFLLEGKEGTKVGEYVGTVVGRDGKSSEVTYFTFDYAVSDVSKSLEGSASYFVPDYFKEPQVHAVYVVLGKEIDIEKAELEQAIRVAKGIEAPAAELVAAIEKAEASNSYLASKADIQGATAALLASVEKNVSFTDTKAHWAAKAIHRGVANSVVNGYTDGTFQPNKSISRAEFTAMIARGIKLPTAANTLAFKDADDIQAWAVPFVKSAVAAEIISGYTDNTFRPADNINRAEVATMIVKALHLDLVSADELTFTDADKIPHYAKAYVATAVKHGLVTGFKDNTFGATKQATRAEAITMVLRAVDAK